MLVFIAFPGGGWAGSTVVTVQDFEKSFEVGTWPESAKVEFSTKWAADGKRSLLIHDGSLASVGDLAVSDWSQYQIWRLHVYVPGESGCVLGLELQDDQTAYHNRHQNNASAPPGESVVDVDIAGDLWRGEVNRPYRGIKTPLNK
ncbi:MAG: hypothetical protein IIA00_10790, partial [Proteobacteria bacterium]|nr:hypothetical protein [Pseudomonadota bacterium]